MNSSNNQSVYLCVLTTYSNNKVNKNLCLNHIGYLKTNHKYKHIDALAKTDKPCEYCQSKVNPSAISAGVNTIRK